MQYALTYGFLSGLRDARRLRTKMKVSATGPLRQSLFRIPMTFMEIFPAGLLVSLVSALLLRNLRILPTTS
jgi:hypothetical protein